MAQLVIKAICLQVNSGVIVNRVVSDGATTNHKFWSELGVIGEKGKITIIFEHPLNNNRKNFMILDAPHLIKNICNRLYNKKRLKVNKKIVFFLLCNLLSKLIILQELSDSNYIRWSHYVEVHKNDIERDSFAPLRVCPKLHKRHSALDSFSKMNVKLATQVNDFFLLILSINTFI